MGLMSMFGRNKARREDEAVHDVMRPWWAWGPLGLIWYGGTHDSHHIDTGQINQTHDGGHFNHHSDHGGGFGGFDGGAGGV